MKQLHITTVCAAWPCKTKTWRLTPAVYPESMAVAAPQGADEASPKLLVTIALSIGHSSHSLEILS